MCLPQCILGLFPLQREKKGAKNVTGKSDFCLSNPKPGPTYRFYKEIFTRKPTSSCRCKPSNALFGIPHFRTSFKARARHQSIGADLDGFKGVGRNDRGSFSTSPVPGFVCGSSSVLTSSLPKTCTRLILLFSSDNSNSLMILALQHHRRVFPTCGVFPPLPRGVPANTELLLLATCWGMIPSQCQEHLEGISKGEADV